MSGVSSRSEGAVNGGGARGIRSGVTTTFALKLRDTEGSEGRDTNISRDVTSPCDIGRIAGGIWLESSEASDGCVGAVFCEGDGLAGSGRAQHE